MSRMIAHQKRPSTVLRLSEYYSNRNRKERSCNQDGTMGTVQEEEVAHLNKHVFEFTSNPITTSTFAIMRTKMLEAAAETAQALKQNPELRVNGTPDTFEIWDQTNLKNTGIWSYFGVLRENFQHGEDFDMQMLCLGHLVSLGEDQLPQTAPAGTNLHNLDDPTFLQ
jgi:hypothetical protein